MLSTPHSTLAKLSLFSQLLVLVFCCSSEARSEQWLNITLTDEAYPPLIIVDPGRTGLLSDIVRESFALGKVRTEFLGLPNNRAIAGLLLGIYEGSYGWGHSPERDAKLIYSGKPIYSFSMVLFQKKVSDISWDSMRDLARYRIGITLGNYYAPEFQSLVTSGVLTVDPADSDIANFTKLLHDRIQLFPIDLDVGLYILKNHFSNQERAKVIYQNKAVANIPVYVVIRRDLKNAVELRDRFDRGFQQLVDSGRYQKMIDVYRSNLAAQP